MEQLLKQIEALISTRLKHEPNFTGSMTLSVNFQDGIPKDIHKIFDQSREPITS